LLSQLVLVLFTQETLVSNLYFFPVLEVTSEQYKGNFPNKFVRTRHAPEAWREFGIV
jgi:hypothetical protein